MPEISESHAADLEKPRTFVPIRTTSLRADTLTAFDLFLKPDNGQEPVLYRERNLPFTEGVRQRLEDSGVVQLYIDTRQEREYQHYVEENLGTILEDTTVPMEEKTELLYSTANILLREMVEDPERGSGIRRSKDLVNSTVNFMADQKNAFHHLMKVTSYDYYTYTHSVNVFFFSVALAQRAGYNDRRLLNDFGQGALLHDIGKSVIDPAIVNAKGKLTDRQWSILKRHPIYGHELLDVPGGLADIGLDAVRHHHEKLSGRGYPDRLTKTRISPLVRIVTISDIFDALTTRRVYKEALSSFDALKVMRAEMADDIDQDVFRLFIQILGTPEDTS